MTPVRIHRRRMSGWKMPPNTVYVGRPSAYGNPFLTGHDGTREECVALFQRWLTGDLSDLEICKRFEQPRSDWFIKMRAQRLGAVQALRGKNIACFCRLDLPCHADVLLDLANTIAGETLERAAADLWRKENPDKSVFACEEVEKARYRARVVKGERP